ncbi:MAG: LamG-like jellyroll fold domain-containing protein [Saprospiraceae bacterium]
MQLRQVLLLGAFQLFCTTNFGQVAIATFPKDNQLYPRNLSTNEAIVHIGGAAMIGATDSLIFTVKRSDGQTFVVAVPGEELPVGLFDQYFAISAELKSYEFKLELKDVAGLTIVATASHVVAGDVFVVQGQSNAQAVYNNEDGNVWQNNFVRCFGNSDPANYLNDQWYIAEANGYFTPGSVGQWPLRMGYLLQETFGVPVAIINGADPGKPIEYFQRNDLDPTDASTNYGRLLQRLTNASIKDNIRGILYYQGESDGDRADIHKTLFEALYQDWVQDYPGVEAYYVVQVREGCGSPSLQLRENQRRFEEYLPNVKCMTANGIAGHDGCHYTLTGYEQIGTKMFKQVAHDLYAWLLTEQLNIRILEASYTKDDNSEVTITTDASYLQMSPGAELDFRISGGAATVTSFELNGNQIILDFDGPVYDDQLGISYAGHSGDAGGWILNSDGFGLYTYYNIPIQNFTSIQNFDIPGIMSGPGNCLGFDGSDDRIYLGSVLGNSYTKEAWIYWNGGGTANNVISGAANTAFWVPTVGNDNYLAGGHNGAWGQVLDTEPMKAYTWTHVAITYDATSQELKLYKNGNLVSSAQGVAAHNDPELYIGAYAGGFTFGGKIDEVRIWNYSRSIEEIRANMCQKLKGDESGLQSYFRLDQLTGVEAENAAMGSSGMLQGFQDLTWQRSAAPIGTKSRYAYTNVTELGLSLVDGDSLLLSVSEVPEFVHLYFTEETPNVLTPPNEYVLVDNHRYFGIFYPNQSIDTFSLTYFYQGNPFSTVNEPGLALLGRKSNAQPFWNESSGYELNTGQNQITTSENRYGEFILALKPIVSAADENLQTKLQIFPNPSNGLVFFKNQQITYIKVFDAHGILRMEQLGNVEQMDMQHLPNGMYLLQLTGDFGTINRKILLAR